MNRWGFFAFLVGVYLLASALSWGSEKWIVPMLDGVEGVTRNTFHRFRQPEAWGLDPHFFPVFLDRVTQHRPGLLASKWLYSGVLGGYLIMLLLVFLRLTSQSGKNIGQERVVAPETTKETL